MKGRIGIEKNGIQVIVTHVPNRRNPVLAIVINGNEEYPVAVFTNEGRADWFIEMMEEFIGDNH